MREQYSSMEKRICDERAKFTRKCSCGHSIMIYPTMKREYTTCGWCHKKVFKDIVRGLDTFGSKVIDEARIQVVKVPLTA